MLDLLIGFDWLKFIPWILGGMGAIFGLYQRSGKEKAKADAAHQKMKAEGESKRATIAEESRDAIFKSIKKTEKAIDEAGKEHPGDRGRFS